jgi:hypothetical protein
LDRAGSKAVLHDAILLWVETDGDTTAITAAVEISPSLLDAGPRPYDARYSLGA